MPDLSHIQLQTQTLDIKDETARNNITTINSQITSINSDITTINSQITSINSDIDSLETVTDRLDNRTWILIGDSYGIQYNSNTYGWTDATSGLPSIMPGTFYTSAVGGAGFCNGTTYYSQLTSLSSSISNKDAVTDIVCIGGINDRNYTQTAIISAIDTFCSYCRTNYPNATVHIGCGEWTPSSFSDYRTIASFTWPAYMRGAAQNTNAKYIANLEWAVHDYSFFQSRSDTHLSDYGMGYFVQSIKSCLLGGEPVYSNNYYSLVSPTLYVGSTGTISNSTFFSSINNGMVTLYNTANISYTYSSSETFTGNAWKYLFSWYNEQGFFKGSLEDTCCCITHAGISFGDGNVHGAELKFFCDGTTTACYCNPDYTGSVTATSFAVTPFQFSVPWYWC